MNEPKNSSWLSRALRKKNSGFGTLDLLLWIVMVGILVTIMAPSIKYAFKRVNMFATDRILDKIDFALSQYSMDMNGYPSRRDGGLTALVYRPENNSQDWRGAYLDGVKFDGDASTGIEIKDRWGNVIEYNQPPVIFAGKYRKYEVVSYGANEEDQSGYLSRGQ